ncbi:3,4-dehydroadipyl-CoA semialdehyde dehydrogenase [Enhygromyxa salina]|uniref:3,4-dehydroadipyl-CoA semialdehyde dehydrogenase n=1 Tax=Enhygromyxa salina TaxID=215803 RepID=A0A2S9YAC7_9BACT|nr:3,4-dehydroadipyl-CoA semialdehyde dehydrogenase [Enhygromyxa salina]PRQ02068.1 3,4-dehydroadipyl-CoA semialdehyde dehydrogenase [Enhygromyxa salina]
MSVQLDSYLQGSWKRGDSAPRSLINPATEREVATIKSMSSSLADALHHGRETGGASLRRLSFAERGELLDKMAKVLHEAREELIDLAIQNGGNTRKDAKFDIDGGISVLAHYAYLAKSLGERPWIVEDEPSAVYRGAKIRAEHILVPRHGLAIHINAFNFPAWGMLGKAAVALLAGMPVLCKPATSTAWLAHRIFEILLDAECVPDGAFQLLMGSAGDLLDHVGPQDVIAFTGSQGVGTTIKTHPAVIAAGTRVNLEADSLNAAVIGPDVESGTELFDLVIRDLVVEITQKAGQKCTATRRVLVPEAALESVREVLLDRLGELAGQTGDPSDKSVRMGPLTSKAQLDDARAGITKLLASAEIIHGDPARTTGFVGVEDGTGYFLEPIVLEAKPDAVLDPEASFHRHEVFAPVTTLLPYDGELASAAKIIGLGKGSLVSTVYTDDREWLAGAVAEIGPWLGRLVVANEKFANASMSPGCVFPVANHGGPGRAGGGEELGGVHGMGLYMQRVAIQGGASQIARLL